MEEKGKSCAAIFLLPNHFVVSARLGVAGALP